MYYLVYNNTTGVVNGCINQKDETKNLLEIFKELYPDEYNLVEKNLNNLIFNW